MVHNKNSVKRKVHSTKCLHKEAGKKKSHTSGLTEHLKTLEQKKANSARRTRWQEINRTEIYKIETKKMIFLKKESMRQRVGSLIKSTK